MVRTIKQGHLDINHREASQDAGRNRFEQTLLNSRNIFTWNRTTLDHINEFESLTRLIRLHRNPYMSVLTLTARLLDELAFDFHLLLDRFAVGNLRSTYVSFNTELTLHSIDNNIEMQLTHTGNDRLTGLFVSTNA